MRARTRVQKLSVHVRYACMCVGADTFVRGRVCGCSSEGESLRLTQLLDTQEQQLTAHGACTLVFCT